VQTAEQGVQTRGEPSPCSCETEDPVSDVHAERAISQNEVDMKLYAAILRASLLRFIVSVTHRDAPRPARRPSGRVRRAPGLMRRTRLWGAR
jgi:hypothetical protein